MTPAPSIVEYIDSGNGYTTVRMSDGSIQTLRGSRGDRNNNPGNLTGTMGGAKRRGAIGVDHGGNYIFPTAAVGQQAMGQMVLKENAGKSVGEMINMYAPPGAANDPNDTNRHYLKMLQNLGVDPSANIGSMPAPKQQDLLRAMTQVEGTTPAQTAPLQPAENPAVMQANPSPQLNPVFPTLRPQENPMVGATEQGAPQGPMMPTLQPQENPMVGRNPSTERSNATLAKSPSLLERQNVMAQAFASPETLKAVSKVGSGRGRRDETIKRRKGFSPENMGLIAFGLTLMGGGDFTDAMDNGLMLHGQLDGMRDEKAQRKASQEILKNVPKEYVPALNALIESKQFDKVAEYSINAKQSAQDAEKEQKMLFTQATREMESLDSATQSAMSVLDQAIAAAEQFEGGLPLDALRAKVSSAVPGTAGASLATALQSARAFTAFSTLQRMREASKTGGALGNVSNVELELLQNSMGSLDINAGLPTLITNLQRIKQRVQDQQGRAKKYYSEDFGVEAPQFEQSVAPASQPAAGELLGTYGGAKVYAG